ncbi:hypothetical protein NRF20_37355 [Streptomyces sp. R-74717]
MASEGPQLRGVVDERRGRRVQLGRRQCPGEPEQFDVDTHAPAGAPVVRVLHQLREAEPLAAVGHDALGAGVGEDDPALDRVLGVAGAPSRAGGVTGPWSRDGTMTVRGALIGLPASFPAAPQRQYPKEGCSARRARR